MRRSSHSWIKWKPTNVGGWGSSLTPDSKVDGDRQRPALSGAATGRAEDIDGLTAVAIATEPTSGAFNDGTQELTEVAKWLDAHMTELPAGQCDH